MTTLPLTLAMIAASSSATNASTSDLNQDGIVNTTDLLAVLAEINTTCRSESCATDLTGDARTTWMDLLFVMDNWGTVPPRSADDDEGHVDGPVLLDAVYYDQYSSSNWRRQLAEQLDQGEHTRSWCTTNDIKVEPIVYGGGVDQDHDGSYSDEDREVFKQWMDENVPADYTGPVCLDMEGQWWSLLSTPSQTVMDHAIDVGGLDRQPCATENLHLRGWLDREDPAMPTENWLRVYGADAPEVMAICDEVERGRDLLHERLPYPRGVVAHAARFELARTVEDVLARRTRALLLDARAASEAADEAATLLAAELGRDEAWAAEQAADFRSLAAGYVLS